MLLSEARWKMDQAIAQYGLESNEKSGRGDHRTLWAEPALEQIDAIGDPNMPLRPGRGNGHTPDMLLPQIPTTKAEGFGKLFYTAFRRCCTGTCRPRQIPFSNKKTVMI